MKRLTKTFVSLVVIVALIMPMLAMLTNTGSVEAATGYITVKVYKEADVWKTYNSNQYRIASSTTSRYYVANYYANVSLDRVNGLGNSTIYTTGKRLDNNGSVSISKIDFRVVQFGRIKTFRGAVSARINIGWKNVNTPVYAPKIKVTIPLSGGTCYATLNPSITYTSQECYVNLVPRNADAPAVAYTNTSAAVANTLTKTTGVKTVYVTPSTKIGGISEAGRKQIVRDLYKRVLKRDAKEADVNFHYNQEPGQIAVGIILSPEADRLNKISSMSNRQFVTNLYKYIFNRNPDTKGLRVNTDYLYSGHSRAQLIKIFASSQEMKNRYK